MSEETEILPPEAALALAWSPQEVRARLTMLLQLDRRLARIVARTSEPMLGQMRLAWWRDALRQPKAARPRGDAVLDGIGMVWGGHEAGLIAMIDGWEVLIGETALDLVAIADFAAGRAAPFMALSDDLKDGQRPVVAQGARCWALTDAAIAMSDPAERALFLEAARECCDRIGKMPRDLRGLAVLAALARRSVRLGGVPLMAGRGASLAVLQAAIFRV
ncbi:squalene/phytoene synthase family protein [Erythrobacter sanguineus]|uniref:Phytoene synthase n=1 Tax=Erythrobacter sanguineus TaxID=198312 RepID=A0A1M7S6D7_9SPHN|nr:squalene/phytoene synthase family protein [Erythrobacter sanguineus]SHN53934.1 phytoene synthase [Erythrobacter sanguineus]